MLDLLIKYASDHGLVTEPGFKPKRARWALVFDTNGRPHGVQMLGEAGAKKNPGRQFDRCPDLSQPEMKAGGDGCRHFLLDSALVVSLFGIEKLDDEDVEKTKSKHEYFVNLLKLASDVIAELSLIADALSDDKVLNQINVELTKGKAKPTDNVTLAVTNPLRFIADSDVWHDWWRQFRRSLGTSHSRPSAVSAEVAGESPMLCMATGELVAPVATHPKLEGLSDVGGLAMGDALVSFKQDSFRSYGLEQSANAAMSEQAASTYRAALNDLLRNHSHKLAGVKIIHWFSGEQDVRPEDDPFEMLNVPVAPKSDDKSDPTAKTVAQSRARKLLESIRTGNRTDLLRYRYYALTLSGNSGRVVIRDWMEGQFEELARSVDQWFAELAISNLSGHRPATAPKLERVVTCLLSEMKQGQKYDDWVKPIGADRLALWKAAVDHNRAIPDTTAARVLLQHVNYVLRGDWERAIDPKERSRTLLLSLLYARMGLLKMFLIRKGDADMSCYLNEDHPDPAYHCGRMMAILADIQLAALPEVKAGVVQRYYAAASATPALVLGRLIRTAQFHLDKVRSDRPKLADEFDEQLASIACRLNPEALPTTLTLQQQCLFALGYYQQKAERKNDD